MNILGHYLGRELLWGVGMTLASLVAIAYFVTFAGEMDHIGTHDFTAETAVLYVMLKMPKTLSDWIDSMISNILKMSWLCRASKMV